MGVVTVAGGLVLGFVAAVVEGSLGLVVVLLLVGAFFGTAMYVLTYRRFIARAVDELSAAPIAAREPARSTKRRVAATSAALLVVVAVVAAVTDSAALGGGILAGNGAALMLTSRWLHRWEREHDTQLLREPRWRWSRKGKRGWGRGRGMMDPQDFYVLASSDASSQPEGS